jgi:hypothetical protein
MTDKMVKHFEDQTDKRQDFIRRRARGQGIKQAFKDAGFSVLGKGWGNAAYVLNRELAPLIKEKIFLGIGVNAVEAKDTVLELMRDPEQPGNVRFNCAKDIMTRAGWDVPLEVNVNDTSKMSETELDTEIADLLAIAAEKVISKDDELSPTQH